MHIADTDQMAFKAEVVEIRAALRALKRDRWTLMWGNKPNWAKRPPIRAVAPDQVDALQQRLLPAQARLRYWQGVLMVGDNIRAPVHVWDVWHKLRNAADLEAAEVEFLSNGRLPRTFVDEKPKGERLG